MEKTIYPELTAMDIDAVDSEDAIRQVGKILFDNGFVKDSYVDAVVKREGVYPTGLLFPYMGIAMPHTDPEHVIKPAVCIAKLKHPVKFLHMGDPDTEVMAEMLFMMAILDPDAQITTLAKTMEVFQNEEAMSEFRGAKSTEDLYNTGVKYINS